MSRRPVELLRYDADALERVAFARAWERGVPPPETVDEQLALVLDALAARSPALGHTFYTVDLDGALAPPGALHRPDGGRALLTLTLADVVSLVAGGGPLAPHLARVVEAVHPYFVRVV